eukprot:g14831.t1
MDDLAQRQATQLRLNAELDAGALATISDMETCLRAPLGRPSNAHNKKASGNGLVDVNPRGGNTARGDQQLHQNGNGNSNGNSISSNGGNAGNARGITLALASTAGRGGGRGRGRGRGGAATATPSAASVSARAFAASSSGPGARPGMASSGPRGPAWDNNTKINSRRRSGDSINRNSSSSNVFSEVNEVDDQLFGIEREAITKGQPEPRSLVSAVARTAKGRDDADAGTPSASSSLFRFSARVKGAARASGEREKMKMKMEVGTGMGTTTGRVGSLSLSPRPEVDRHGDTCNDDFNDDDLNTHGNGTSEQEQEGLRLAEMRPGSSEAEDWGRGKQQKQQKQQKQIAGLSEDGDHRDRNRGNFKDTEHDDGADTALIPSEGFGIPAGIGHEATATMVATTAACLVCYGRRFLKAKLTSCQAQLEEVLQAHHASQQEATELRRQSASEQEQLRRVTRQLQQLQQNKTKESKVKEEESLNAASLSARMAELERELGSFRRAARQSETEKKSLEVRLHRALEEIARQKEAVRQTQGQHKDLGQGQRLEMSRLEGQCQRLERQKLELLSAFKKQLKLIDVLKRQKFHVEAARLLSFTEEDFVKTLDWDSR